MPVRRAHELANEPLEDLEIELLLEGLQRHYGCDFRDYNRTFVRGALRAIADAEQVDTISALQNRLLHDAAALGRALPRLASTETALFGDPESYAAMRSQVFPRLRAHPSARIWVAGCATGEEVYSTAILLQEEGIYERCRIYATDFNEEALRVATAGVYPKRNLEAAEARYLAAGGRGSLLDHCITSDDSAAFRPKLKRNLFFAQHNLVTDGSFNEFQVIVCRGVMGWFNSSLQERVHRLLFESLARFGILGLGPGDSIAASPQAVDFLALDEKHRLFQKRT